MTTEAATPHHPRPNPVASVDPLLTVVRILLFVLLAGLSLAAFAVAAGLIKYLAWNGLPIDVAIWHPEWRTINQSLFALGALWLVGEAVFAVIRMIAAVAAGEAFAAANVARLETIAWNTIGLAVLGAVARFAGTGIRGDVNGFELAVDLPTSIGFALLLFVLARVFRQGAAIREELEGTV